jgi:hypothetical protein
MKSAKVVCALLTLSACGGGSAPGTQTPTNSTTASSNSETPAMSKLGRFSTADGMVHVVVDRTGPKAKLQVEGASDIFELTQSEVRERGDLQGYAFVAPSGNAMLFIDTNGGMTYIKGATEHSRGDRLPLLRSADAKPLGPATIAGAPPGPKAPEKSKAVVTAEEFAKKSVIARFPQFKPADAGNLAKVAEAYQLATADMVMHCGEGCNAWYAPHPIEGQTGQGGLGFVSEKDLRDGPATEAEKKSPLAKFNGWLRPNYELGEWTHKMIKWSSLAVFQLEFKPLEPKTPVLVWNVAETDVVVVTPDGGRYWDSPLDSGDKPIFVPGAPPAAEWPKPLRNNLLHPEHIKELTRLGLVDQKLGTEYTAIQDKWSECVQKVFVPAQKEVEGNLAGGERPFTVSNKNKLLVRRYNTKAMSTCGGVRAEAILVEILAKREKEQLALYEKNKARLATLK